MFDYGLKDAAEPSRQVRGDNSPPGYMVTKAFSEQGVDSVVRMKYTVGGRKGQRWGRRYSS